MKCPYCKEDIRDGLVFCPLCGKKVEYQESGEVRAPSGGGGPSWIIFAATLAVMGLVFAGYEGFVYFKARQMKEIGLKAHKHGDYKACVNALIYVVGKNPKGSGEVRVALADCYLQSGEAEKAIKQMETAAGWTPKDAGMLSAWSEMLYRAGEACGSGNTACAAERFAGAEEKALAALKLSAKDYKALKFAGLARIKLGKYKEAAGNLRAAIGGAQGDQAVEINNRLADALTGLGDKEGAIKALEASLKIYLNQPETLMAAAELYLEKKDYNKCDDYAESALEIATQRKDIPQAKRATKLTDSCRAVVLMEKIRNCISDRRAIDLQYMGVENDVLTFIKEAEAEPGDYVGKPSDTLTFIHENAVSLKEKYTRIACKTDYEAMFKKSVWVFTGTVEALDVMTQKLARFLELQDNDTRKEFEASKLEFIKQREGVYATWKIEEEKFGFEQIMKGAKDLPVEKPLEPTKDPLDAENHPSQYN